MNNLTTIAASVILHFVSPEFKPRWRMVSEYALGKNKWLITSFFIFWSISSLLAAYLYFNIVTTTWASIGAILIFISGIGALMGGLFDLKHKLHGLAFALGVPTFPLGVLLVAYHLSNQNKWLPYKIELLASAHGVWITVVLMAVSMGLFFSGLKKAGIPFGPDQEPLTEIPKGVTALHGYANRLLVLVHASFNIIAASIFLNI